MYAFAIFIIIDESEHRFRAMHQLHQTGALLYHFVLMYVQNGCCYSSKVIFFLYDSHNIITERIAINRKEILKKNTITHELD